MPHRRMAPETPAAPFDKRAAADLGHARCLFHPLREAAARCPHCRGTFCRECVTDEEGKLACPPCLRRMARPPAPKPALAPSTLQRGRAASSARGRRNRLNALEALERGFALFKSTFAWEAWRYYSGAAPLVLCFIPMWVVNGQIRISDAVLLTQAALLTGAYLLRAWSVSNYMQRVRERAFGVPRPRPEDAAAQLAAMGRLLAWKIVLSAATLVALTTFAGAPWCYSACQFASLEAREDGSKRQTIGGCLALASQWFGGGLLLFLMLFPLWIAVWLNGLIVALLVPQLLHSIFGVNTLLSTPTGMFALFRSSAFWLSLFAGAWLALDPIVKCSFVVVYQR